MQGLPSVHGAEKTIGHNKQAKNKLLNRGCTFYMSLHKQDAIWSISQLYFPQCVDASCFVLLLNPYCELKVRLHVEVNVVALTILHLYWQLSECMRAWWQVMGVAEKLQPAIKFPTPPSPLFSLSRRSSPSLFPSSLFLSLSICISISLLLPPLALSVFLWCAFTTLTLARRQSLCSSAV